MNKEDPHLYSNDSHKYNFQYSYAQYSPIIQSSAIEYTQQSSQPTIKTQSIMIMSNFIIHKKCFKEQSIADQVQNIITHIWSFKKITLSLLDIIQICMSKSQKTNDFKDESKLQIQRQALIKNIQDFSQQSSNQKTKYLRILSLICSLTIFKVLKHKKSVKNLQFQTIFHKIYWEIIGQHSTKNILDQLIDLYINKKKLAQFLNQLPEKIKQPTFLLNSVIQKNWSIQTFGGIRQSQNLKFYKRQKQNNLLKSNSHFNEFLQDFKKFKGNVHLKQSIQQINIQNKSNGNQNNQMLRFGNILNKRCKDR